MLFAAVGKPSHVQQKQLEKSKKDEVTQIYYRDCGLDLCSWYSSACVQRCVNESKEVCNGKMKWLLDSKFMNVRFWLYYAFIGSD